MPRFRHVKSGAVVSVSDDKSARMDAEWEPLEDEKKAQSKPAAKKAAARKSGEK